MPDANLLLQVYSKYFGCTVNLYLHQAIQLLVKGIVCA